MTLDEVRGQVMMVPTARAVAELDDQVSRRQRFEATMHQWSADHECPHGGLAADRHRQPGCDCAFGVKS